MTLKCWTTATTQDGLAAQSAATLMPSTARLLATPMPTTPNGNGVRAVTPTGAASSSAARSNVERRRRSVEFFTSAPLSIASAPTRLPIHHKAHRCRSMSSTLDTTDSDDDDIEEEEDEDGDGEDDHHHHQASTRSRHQRHTELGLARLQISTSSENQQEHDATAAVSPAAASPSTTHTPRRRSRRSRHRRRRTVSESSGSHHPSSSRRLRILTPVASPVCFAGWVRGQPAEVRWEAVDKTVLSVRIDVCNVAWSVPTTIAQRVPNDGSFEWKRVYWGMPITNGYYVNIYDVTHVAPEQEPGQQASSQQQQQQPQGQGQAAPRPGPGLVLLARSEYFAVIG
ncbi:hypothetical protein PINS_up008912 [Pythium insidiosum]|nr:hypothetical protein PINS_up008912 [Pythium insidiosum]